MKTNGRRTEMSNYIHDDTYSPSPVFYESCVDDNDDYVPTYGGVAVQQNSPTPEIDDFVDENFLLAALFGAIEEGNLQSIQELFENSSVDPNQCNKHGESLLHYCAGLGQLEIFKYLVEIGADLTVVDDQDDTAVHWASRQNQPQIIRYVYDQTASIESVNKNLETPLHVAARYGHVEAVEQLCKCGANINATDEHGETAILIAVWHGFPKIVHILGEIGANTDARNKEDETALHVASARGHPECVRCLLDAGADPNLRNKNSFTPLHLALKRQHSQVAMLLLKSGANHELADCVGDRAIHYAARYNLIQICQWLCQNASSESPSIQANNSRCQVNVPNKHGLYPLHIAAKSGHIEIVRTLCLAGSMVDARDADSMIPQICAIAQSHNDIADLLTRLRNERQKDEFIQQLNPTPGTPLARMKLRIFGHCASGKSTLIESLKCGYFSSWFRRSKSMSTSNSQLQRSAKLQQSQQNGQSELSIISGSQFASLDGSSNGLSTSSYENPTPGIDSQHCFISGVGEIAIWEFSGSPVYYQLYDHFLVDTSTCLNAIVFRLSDSPEVQLESILFWLRFIQSRQALTEPLFFGGRCIVHSRVVLVATHADLVQTIHGSLDSANYALRELLAKVIAHFRSSFDIHPEIFTMDASVAGSAGMRNFKAHLSLARTNVLSSPEVPNSTRFLDSCLTFLNLFRKVSTNFPVLQIDLFRDMIRSQINPLASDEHFRDLLSQLVIMGEIIHLSEELIILCPKWLTCDIIGKLLAMKCNPQSYFDLTTTQYEQPATAANNRINGIYSIDEFQDLFHEVDALDLLQLLETLRLCTQNDKSGDIEYEFPCFIVSGDLDQVLEQFQFRDHCVYHGILYKCNDSGTSGSILSSVFPRIQTELRAQLRGNGNYDIDDLHNCHKFSYLIVEEHQMMMLISVDSAGDSIELRFCGAHDSRRETFFFAQDILQIIEYTIEHVVPGLQIQKSYYSPEALKNQRENLAVYSSSSIMKTLLTAPVKFTSTQLLKRKIKSDDGLVEERLNEVLSFGIANLTEVAIPLPGGGSIDPLLASELHSSNLSLLTKQKLCQLLDPPEDIGRDWCMFGILLGMTDKLPKLDPNSPTTGNAATSSPTGRVIEECVRNVHCTIRIMYEKLMELNRFDAAEVILQTAPLLKVHPLTSLPEEGTVYNDEGSHTSLGVGTLSHTSSSNLSR